MAIQKDILNGWFKALEIDAINLNNNRQKAFKETYPFEYGYLSAFYHLRTRMKRDLKVLQFIGEVQWFTLTFDNKRDKNKITSKRKSATRFLADLFLAYEIVEEFGEDNGRYHIHGFGVYKLGRGFADFIKWPCRTKIETLDGAKVKKKIHYLTNYAVKDLPRIRRSKSLVFLLKKYNLSRALENSFQDCFKCQMNVAICKASFSLYN